jgi:hypothetical protein
MDNKNIFLVLGMARSGTSAITRGLNALGIELGSMLTPANPKWNPKGFWEDSEVVYQINAKIFHTLCFQPYGIDMPDRQQLLGNALDDVRQSAINLLKQRFANTAFWGFKDPSTIKLLPFWQDVFSRLNIQDNYIIALRNPLSVAISYKKLTEADVEIGLLLWLMHSIQAIDETHHKKRLVVSYEHLLQNPKRQLERIQQCFNVPTLTSPEEIHFYANSFIDKTLHHYEYKQEEFSSHAQIKVIPLCSRVYNLLDLLANDALDINQNEFTSQWLEIKTELEKIYPLYSYVDTLLKQLNVLKRTLNTIHKSVPWKILSPLRKMDDVLRKHRKKKRESRKINKAYG